MEAELLFDLTLFGVALALVGVFYFSTWLLEAHTRRSLRRYMEARERERARTFNARVR